MKVRRISRYSEDIFNAILRLLPQLSADAKLPTKELVKKMLNSKNSYLLVAELNDGNIIGMLTIGTYLIPSKMKVWIEDVVIDESYRGKGIGKELTLFAIEYSKSLGAEVIELTSKPARIEANKLYQHLGFVKHETNMYRIYMK